ncbi:unnamed protein product [Closterium sp. NIES-64]|nr:unnamed protein product [Closterium sp. NIES-64]
MLFHSRFIPHPLPASLLQRRGITRALEGDFAAAARSGASRDARADDAVCAQAANERVGARGEAMGDARGNESAGATCGDIDRREINPFGSSWSGENRNRVSVSISQFGDRVSVNPAGDSASHASMRPINAATMTPDGGAADGAASIDGRCDPRGDVLTMAPDGGAAEGVATRPVDASTMAAEGAASIDGRCDSRDDDGAGWRRDGEAAKRANSLSVALRNAATVEHLDLTASDDLQCTNLMCPKVTEPCICRLGVALSRLPRLTSLTLAHNGLEALPESLSSLTSLRHLDLSHNRLSSPPFDLTSALPHLKSLVLSGNPCAPSTPSHAPPLQKSNEDQ